MSGGSIVGGSIVAVPLLYSSFEVFECLLRNVNRTYRLSVIYHSTQKVKYEETKIGAFMEQFESYLHSISDKSGIPVICGDFNFKVNLPSDKYAQNFINLYKKTKAKVSPNILINQLTLLVIHWT